MTKNTSVIFAAISLCLITASLIYFPSNNKPSAPEQREAGKQFSSTKALLDYFHSINYLWPITDPTKLPDVLIQSMPSDINTVQDYGVRKTVFIRVMLPIILATQERIRKERASLMATIKSGNTIQNQQLTDEVNSLFDEYNIDNSLSFQEKGDLLLLRYDELPLTLVLAQAAIESGWGTSRFTRVGNSLFGEWTYKKNAGIVPEDRQAGKSHQIKAFPSLQDSVTSYIRNINRNNAYKELREYRAEMRSNQQPLDARKLAEGLHRYSQKGKSYIVSLLQILNSKEFKQIESLKLDTI